MHRATSQLFWLQATLGEVTLCTGENPRKTIVGPLYVRTLRTWWCTCGFEPPQTSRALVLTTETILVQVDPCNINPCCPNVNCTWAFYQDKIFKCPTNTDKKKTTLREDLNQSHSNRVVFGFLTNSRYSTHLEFKTVSRFSFESGKYFKKCFCEQLIYLYMEKMNKTFNMVIRLINSNL